MQLAGVNYRASMAARVATDALDAFTVEQGWCVGQQDGFAHELSMATAGAHGVSALGHLYLSAHHAAGSSRPSPTEQGKSGRHLAIALADGVAATGFGLASHGLGWHCYLIAGAGSVVSTMLQAGGEVKS